MKIEFKKFNDLSNKEIWEIFKNRSEVFVVEQEWLACDIDDKDLIATHVMMRNEQDDLIGYLRIFDIDDKTLTFGRVLTPKKFRGQKYGIELLKSVIAWLDENKPKKDIQISAQYRLLDFYKKFGFTEYSEVFDDDGIDHIKMIISAK